MRNPMLILLICAVCGGACDVLAADLDWYKWRGIQEIAFGGYISEMNGIKIIDAQNGQDRRIVYGDRQGLVHVLKLQDGRFKEVWSSQALRGAVSEVFVDDIDADGELEIVAYTEQGDIAFYRASDYKQIWRSTVDQFASIGAMTVTNIDNDPQLELVFCGEDHADLSSYRSNTGSDDDRARQIGRLFVFDCKHRFVEWRTEQGIWGTNIVVGDLDGDGQKKIAINTGFIIDASYQRVEWQYQDGFGEKLGYADIDGDGIPELIGEFHSQTRPHRFIRIFDVDLQSESFLSSGR